MNAKEARTRALEVNTDVNDSQYAIIKKMIKTEVECGNYHTYVYVYIKPDVQKKLESEGFNIENLESFRNETTIKISW